MRLFGPPNVPKMRQERDIKGLFRALRYRKDHRVREAAAAALFTLGDARVVEPWIAALRDGERHVRWAAAYGLGKLVDSRAVEPLIAALQDGESIVRSAAAVSLGQIGDPDAVDPLIPAGAAAFLLGRSGDTRAVEPLIAALQDGDSLVRRSAAKSLGWIGDGRAAEPLIVALQDGDRLVRCAAAMALGKIGEPAVGPLMAALQDDNGWVRKGAADALRWMGWQPGPDETGAAYYVAKEEWIRCIEIGSPAVGPLIAALKDSQSLARKSAAEALGQLGDARAVGPLIAALQDSDDGVRLAAPDSLVKIGGPAVGPLMAALQDCNGGVRKRAADALQRLGWRPGPDETGAAYYVAKEEWIRCIEIGAPAVGPLIAALKDGQPLVSKSAAEALGRIGDARAVGPLLAVSVDGDGSVWQAAAEAALGGIGEPAVALLAAKLQRGGDGWRKAAARMLGGLGAPAVAPLVAALKDGEVRSEATDALVRIGAPAVVPLIAALEDKDENVRLQAVYALRRIDDTRAVGPLVSAINDRNPRVASAAAKALCEMDWQPGRDESSAAYWVMRERWDKCAEIGAPAVAALIAALKKHPWAGRRGAADALVKVYQSALLDDDRKRLILDQRRRITAPHADFAGHDDNHESFNDCKHADHRSHEDKGIGVAFPV